MFEALSQTQPSIPGVDPGWLSQPGVKTVIAVSAVVIVTLTLWKLVISPLVIDALKSAGLIRRTWKEQMEADVKAVALAAKDIGTAQSGAPMPNVSPGTIGTLSRIGTGDGGKPYGGEEGGNL